MTATGRPFSAAQVKRLIAETVRNPSSMHPVFSIGHAPAADDQANAPRPGREIATIDAPPASTSRRVMVAFCVDLFGRSRLVHSRRGSGVPGGLL